MHQFGKYSYLLCRTFFRLEDKTLGRKKVIFAALTVLCNSAHKLEQNTGVAASEGKAKEIWSSAHIQKSQIHRTLEQREPS